MSEAPCCACSARPRPPTDTTRSWRGSPSSRTRSRPAGTNRFAARADSCATWAEAVEIVAAAYVCTVKSLGPHRTTGFSPIPAMSPVSFSSCARFHQLIGGSMLSFYDWYADLPPASPQVFGDQTDVPESGDWWNSSYLMMWGSNVPLTRTPDAHWMA